MFEKPLMRFAAAHALWNETFRNGQEISTKNVSSALRRHVRHPGVVADLSLSSVSAEAPGIKDLLERLNGGLLERHERRLRYIHDRFARSLKVDTGSPDCYYAMTHLLDSPIVTGAEKIRLQRILDETRPESLDLEGRRFLRTTQGLYQNVADNDNHAKAIAQRLRGRPSEEAWLNRLMARHVLHPHTFMTMDSIFRNPRRAYLDHHSVRDLNDKRRFLEMVLPFYTGNKRKMASLDFWDLLAFAQHFALHVTGDLRDLERLPESSLHHYFDREESDEAEDQLSLEFQEHRERDRLGSWLEENDHRVNPAFENDRKRFNELVERYGPKGKIKKSWNRRQSEVDARANFIRTVDELKQAFLDHPQKLSPDLVALLDRISESAYEYLRFMKNPLETSRGLPEASLRPRLSMPRTSRTGPDRP